MVLNAAMLFVFHALLLKFPHFSWIYNHARHEYILPALVFAAFFGQIPLWWLLGLRRAFSMSWRFAVLAAFACATVYITFLERERFFPHIMLEFVRIGHVSPHSVHINMRNPVCSCAALYPQCTHHTNAHGYAHDSFSWQNWTESTTVVDMPHEANTGDHIAHLEVDDLTPDSSCTVRIKWFACRHNLRKITGVSEERARDPGSDLPGSCRAQWMRGARKVEDVLAFDTPLPQPASAHDQSTRRFVRFSFNSCMFRWFQPLLGVRTIIRQSPDFLLVIGDVIYSDHPVFKDFSAEQFKRLYRETFADRFVQKLHHKVPTYYMFDDHEVHNGFVAQSSERRSVRDLPAESIETDASKMCHEEVAVPDADIDTALRVWSDYCAYTNPHPFPPSDRVHYYTFTRDMMDYFVLDTRSHRSSTRVKDAARKTMLGALQKRRVKEWLLQEPATVKWLVSPVAWSFGTHDAELWWGFQHEREELLDFIRDHRVPVVLLSGDLHWSFVTEVRPGIMELSFSPIDAFLMYDVTLQTSMSTDDPLHMLFEHEQTAAIVDVCVNSRGTHVARRGKRDNSSTTTAAEAEAEATAAQVIALCENNTEHEQKVLVQELFSLQSNTEALGTVRALNSADSWFVLTAFAGGELHDRLLFTIVDGRTHIIRQLTPMQH